MDSHIRAATLLAEFLDNKFSFLGFRFGMNGIIGLIPVVGDLAVSFLSLYLVWIGLRMRLPLAKIIHMLWNIGFNFLLGLLPFIGDAVDFFNHANLKNLKILKNYTDRDEIKGQVAG